MGNVPASASQPLVIPMNAMTPSLFLKLILNTSLPCGLHVNKNEAIVCWLDITTLISGAHPQRFAGRILKSDLWKSVSQGFPALLTTCLKLPELESMKRDGAALGI